MSKKRNGGKKDDRRRRKNHGKTSKRQSVGHSSKITNADAKSSQTGSAAAKSKSHGNQIKTW